MRKLIFIALMMLTATTAVMAQNELYIYRQGGQTDTLQLEQVASISHSRIDPQGTEQADYVIMAIRLNTTVPDGSSITVPDGSSSGNNVSERQYVLSQLDSVVVQRGDVRTHLTHFIGGKEAEQRGPLHTSLDGDFTATSTAVNYFWQEDDHIYLDIDCGKRDNTVEISESKAVADFTFDGTLTADTYTVYYNGQTPRAYNKGSIAKEQDQQEENTSGHIGLAGDCGTATAVKQGDGSYLFNLDHHAAYLCFLPYIGNDLERTELRSITVHCDGLIAGDYTFSTEGLTLDTEAENRSHAITLTTGDFVLPERATKNTSAYMVVAPQSGAVRLTCEFTVYDTLLESTGVYTKTVDLPAIAANTVYVIKANCNNYVVDLGLPVKFMNHNVGAFAPEERGGYYAWGEMEDKGTYTASNYSLNNVDVGKNIRHTEYDVAYVKYGNTFSMPTVEELYLLTDSCKAWTWTTINGVSGYKVTGKNDNHLFLPAAGYRNYSNAPNVSNGYYRSSQLVPSSEVRSPNLTISSSTHNISKGSSSSDWTNNYVGNSVRPVVSSGAQMTDGTLVQVMTEGVDWNVGETTATLQGSVNGLAKAKLTTTEAGFIIGTLDNVTKADLSNVTKISKTVNADGSYTCSFAGPVEDFTVYYYRAYIKTADDSISYANIRQFGREYIDLGLPSGNLWSNINLGASSPDKDGGFYAWAETATKSIYTEATHTTYVEKTYLFPEALRDIQATRYDAAAQALGSVWMTPDYDDVKELLDNCTISQQSVNGMAGYRFTSKNNGNSIFIPKSGYHNNASENYSFTDTYYLSSTLTNTSSRMYDIYNANTSPQSDNRYYGLTLRPIYKRHEGTAENHPLFVRTLPARKKYDGTLETDTLRAVIRGMMAGDTAGFRWWKAADGEETATAVAATPDATGYIETVISSSANSLVPGAAYCFQAFVNDGTNNLYGETKKFTAVGAVDLGLSVNWMNTNVGAENEGAAGDCYRWGGIAPYRRKAQQFTAGTGLTIENGRDIANVLYGGLCRMPTRTEMNELRENCTWTWNTTDYETAGYVVTGKDDYSDRSIFLPAAGYYGENSDNHYSDKSPARYWLSSVNNDATAYALHFDNGGATSTTTDNKQCGFSVRPVQEKSARVRTQGCDWTIGSATATLHGSAILSYGLTPTSYGFVVGNNIDLDATADGANLIWANNRDGEGAFSVTYTYEEEVIGAPRFFRSFIKVGDIYYQGNIKAITAALLDVEFQSEALAINGAKSTIPVNRYTSTDATTVSDYDEDYHRYVSDMTQNPYSSNSAKLYYLCYYGDQSEFMNELADGHSIEVLFKVGTVPTSDSEASIMSSAEYGGSGICLRDKHLSAYFYVGGTYRRIETDITPAADTYYHIVAVWSKGTGTMTVYVNGAAAKTLVDETNYKKDFRDSNSKYYAVGCNPSGGTGAQECFNGYVALGRVYGDVLTAEQVQQLYNALKK